MSGYFPGAPVVTLLDTNGDGTGVFEANGDYSLTPTDFIIKPDTGQALYVTKLTIWMRDASINSEDAYGGIAGGLTNGLFAFLANESGELWRYPHLARIRANRDFVDLFHRSPFTPTQTAHVPINFLTLTGQPIELTNGDYFGVRLNDDFTGLLEHRFVVYGAAT